MDQVKSHWRRLAIALKFPQHEISNIASQDDQVCYLLSEWLRGANQEKDPRPVTWRTFITALRDANIQDVADVLENHFIQTPKATSGELMVYVQMFLVLHSGFAYKCMYRFVSYASNVHKNHQEVKLLGTP